METNEKTGGIINQDKIDRYNWEIIDEPGIFRYISKNILNVDDEYQRKASAARILSIARKWSWVALGVIIVAQRNPGAYFVLDGQHRVLAALRRSDINELPCLVFNSLTLPDEAKDFVKTNTARKAITSIDRFNANIVAQDVDTIRIRNLLISLDISMGKDSKRSIGSVALLMTLGKQNFDKLKDVLKLLLTINPDIKINERILGGFYYLSFNLSVSISDKRFVERVRVVGDKKINDSISETSSYYAQGGQRVYAVGILKAINTGLRNKFLLKIKDAEVQNE